MITGAHSVIYSREPEADRAFLRDVLGFPNVDAGDGWLIFGLPPSEVAVHPSERNDVHEFYLICDDVRALTTGLRGYSVNCTEIQDHGWGLLTRVTLPGGGTLGIYEPRHARPGAAKAAKATSSRTRIAAGSRDRAARPARPKATNRKGAEAGRPKGRVAGGKTGARKSGRSVRRTS